MLDSLGIQPTNAGRGLREKYKFLVEQVRDVIDAAGQKQVADIATVVDAPVDSELDQAKRREMVRAGLESFPETIERELSKSKSSAVTIDDITPNDFKQALVAVSGSYKSGSVIEVRDLFRLALTDVQKKTNSQRRLNVVNSNFSRMYQYLEEVYEDEIGMIPYGRGNNLTTAKIKFER